MKQVLLTVLLAAGIVTAAAAPTVDGAWTMTVSGSPHGDAAMGLTLKQDGTKVSGTFSSPHGDMAIAGEFVNGELKLSTTSGTEDEKILFSARLRDDGTLAGSVSSPMGDMTWTARRAAGQDGK
ncbi:MAG TPA: hypothetical protein VGI12_11250 [Vicinamibacterales bacterium]|jgi:opacity protein-like surface antigen